MKFRIRKPLIWLVALGVPGGLCWLTYLFYTIDEDPPADGHLRPVRPAVAFEENGFHLLNFTAEQVYWPEESSHDARDIGFTEAWDGKLAADILQRNREILEKFDRSMERTRFQFPEIASCDTAVPEVMACREIAYVAKVRICSLFLAGRDRETADESMKLIRFGHRLEGGGGALVYYLVGLAVKSTGVDCLSHIIRRTRLGASELLPYLQDLSAYYPSRDGLIEAFKVEYRLTADLLDRIARGDPDLLAEVLEGHPLRSLPRSLALLLFNPNKTKRMFAEAFPVMIEAIGKCQSEAGMVRLPADTRVLQKNAVGRMLFEMMIPAELRYFRRAELRVSKTRLLIALLCYHRAHGRLPATLDVLVTEYLKEVPRDPYDGRPIRYSAEKKLLWAVGEDLRDEGGTPPDPGEEIWRDANEPTFRIEF